MTLARKPKAPSTTNPFLQITSTHCTSLPPPPSDTDRIAKLINDHPFPRQPLLPLLHHHLKPPLLSPSFLDSLLTRLFAGHANGHKALEIFKFSLHHPVLRPTVRALNTTLHILVRMRDFDAGWKLMEEVGREHPSLLTIKTLGIVLAKYVKFRSFDDALEAFDRMEKRVFVGKVFGVDEFNVLLRAFCAQKKMMEARAVFRKLHPRFTPNSRTLNILLLGFKETRNITALDLFYHEMIIRGFKPDAITYNIRIDAYCKKGRFSGALEIFEEMGKLNYLPTLETMTTLIHGASIVQNPCCAQRLFDEMLERNLTPDIGAYNALMDAYVRTRDLKSGMKLMDEMEAKGIEHDDLMYYTMFWGLKKYGGVENVLELYRRMVDRNFVPNTRTVVMLMKFFCENRRPDLGLELWGYIVEKGCCPHGHALDLLVTGLCCRGKVEEAFQCFKQVVERGRHPSERGFQVLEGFLVRGGDEKKLKELTEILRRLQAFVPPSKGHALYDTASSINDTAGLKSLTTLCLE